MQHVGNVSPSSTGQRFAVDGFRGRGFLSNVGDGDKVMTLFLRKRRLTMKSATAAVRKDDHLS
jgi:hypothetical protein